MMGARGSSPGLRALILALLALGAIFGFWSWLRGSRTLAPPRGSAGSVASAGPRALPVTPPSAAGTVQAPQVSESAFPGLDSVSVEEQKTALLSQMQEVLRLDAEQVARTRAIFASSKWLSLGNPEITRHPMTRHECRVRRAEAEPLPKGDPRCAAVNMVPLYASGESEKEARACIDQYEFPNIPCEYPVVWVRADQAALLCRSLGKRICDAHEWEGACAGALKKPETEYAFGERRQMIEYLHNKDREIVWSYGATKDHAKCATGSKKSPKCSAIGWQICGSNTYPAGAFPLCRSRLGAFDLHGNAAEHMNLPLRESELASRGGLGETEMKGSWFIFQSYEAHPDDCRFRAPMWHVTRMDDENSHRNYHLGFRCCKDIQP